MEAYIRETMLMGSEGVSTCTIMIDLDLLQKHRGVPSWRCRQRYSATLSQPSSPLREGVNKSIYIYTHTYTASGISSGTCDVRLAFFIFLDRLSACDKFFVSSFTVGPYTGCSSWDFFQPKLRAGESGGAGAGGATEKGSTLMYSECDVWEAFGGKSGFRQR